MLDLGSDEGYKSKQFLPPDPSSFLTPHPHTCELLAFNVSLSSTGTEEESFEV